MATATKKKVLNQTQFGGTPYGNKTALQFNLTTNASGVWTDSDLTTAVVSGTVCRIGVLPAGFKITGALAIISDLFTASVTCSIGILAVDGVTTQDDADYLFLNTLALSATARTFATNTAVAPITLARDHYIIVTTGGADIAAAGVLDVLVEGVLTGAP